ncbi:Hypothetical protein Minf_1955 [Methylacidiphilum infernorum V4]|uniref:Uncharacterized protein n=1 Tax=Methylacidiphilum infernorum (isolate V4) TaxID=481448 RepID=B3DYG1_METI4|nr:Hypothetical protein Minf_1955 [Methylacidiphilum infernorum V4]
MDTRSQKKEAMSRKITALIKELPEDISPCPSFCATSDFKEFMVLLTSFPAFYFGS